MNKALQNVVNFYVYANFHIGVCAAVFVAGGFKFIDAAVSTKHVVFVFCATLSIYTAHRLIGIGKLSTSCPNRFAIFVKNKYLGLWQLVIAILIMTLLVMDIGLTDFFFLAPTGILTLAYIFPLLKGRRLRDYSVFKIFILSITWACVFAWPQYLYHGTNILFADVFWFALGAQFLFILGLCLAFDKRDMLVDKEAALLTIPNTLGIYRTNWLIVICFVCCGLFTVGLVIIEHLPLQKLFLLISLYTLSGYMCIKDEEKSELYYLGTLDGLILVNGVIYLI